jgi:uncharacterized linocin/CFP29 family protein
MENQNSLIINQGYIGEGQILNPLSMRPYRNARGIPVVAELSGIRQNADGSQSPVYRERQVFTNALLRLRDWEAIDAEVTDVMRQPLVGVNDLLSAGLTTNLGGIGVSLTTYEQISDMSAASVSMSVTPKKGENDGVAFTPISIPVPIISKPFTLDIRTLDASRRNGHEGLDTTQVRVATIKVRETMESMLFTGSPAIQVDTFKIYGYKNAPYRDTATAAQYGGADWGTADGNAHKTIVGMISALNAKGFFGPFGLYVNATQYAELLALTGDGNFSTTQLDVILRTIPDLKFVRRTSSLVAGECVLVQLTKEVVDYAIGMDVTPVSWQEFGGLVNEFRVMAAAVARIKYDANLSCGVAHATGC